jgi:hypothetical protein
VYGLVKLSAAHGAEAPAQATAASSSRDSLADMKGFFVSGLPDDLAIKVENECRYYHPADFRLGSLRSA